MHTTTNGVQTLAAQTPSLDTSCRAHTLKTYCPLAAQHNTTPLCMPTAQHLCPNIGRQPTYCPKAKAVHVRQGYEQPKAAWPYSLGIQGHSNTCHTTLAHNPCSCSCSRRLKRPQTCSRCTHQQHWQAACSKVACRLSHALQLCTAQHIPSTVWLSLAGMYGSSCSTM